MSDFDLSASAQAKVTPVNISPTFSRLLLFSAVSLSGGAVMILELLGTRIIAPYYGVSLYVWSSLISVTMIALALGYYVGGFLTDRYPRVRLPHVFMLAALTTALIPFFSGTVMLMTNPLGIRGGAFVSALLLFTLPLTALAMVGPFVIKLATENLQGIGRAVGSVYAISTLGSVAGTLLLGFYLLPIFGTRLIIFVVSGVLIALAIFLSIHDKLSLGKSLLTLPLIVATALIITLTSIGYARPLLSNKEFKVVYQEESVYGWVRVVDDLRYGVRLLLSDSSVLSAMSIANGQTLLGYQQIIGLLPLVRPSADNALLIGLGGGHIARDLKSKGLSTDTIEIDPAVADASLKYFNFKPTGEFIVGDGRYEIQKLHKRYHFIIHDCFTGGTEPTHMLTLEMLTQLRGMLTDQGVLALNYVGFTNGDGTKAVASVYRTLKEVFPNIRVFITDKAEFTDFIFLSSTQPIILDRSNPDLRVQWLLSHEYTLSDTDGIIITDNFNPMESLQIRKSEYYRKVFMERVTPDLLML